MEEQFSQFCPLWMQVVMPTVESDVAFGLGKLKLPLDEVRLRVSKSLDAVGMLSYSQVGI
jgi:energy-coupling factor transporter ATP-binding protein EcfA2